MNVFVGVFVYILLSNELFGQFKHTSDSEND